MAAKRVNDVVEVSKKIPGVDFRIDVVLTDGRMIECKTGKNWATQIVNSDDVLKLKDQIKTMRDYAPDKQIIVTFKDGVSQEVRDWLINVQKVVVEG